jgi:hypothetical protein
MGAAGWYCGCPDWMTTVALVWACAAEAAPSDSRAMETAASALRVI